MRACFRRGRGRLPRRWLLSSVGSPRGGVDDHFVVPLDALQVAMVGAAMEIADGRPNWVEDRERVGHRAEAYSLRLEREQHGAGAVLHVSRDEGDQFGYDLEDISIEPSRLIECKGSRSRNVSFVMSVNELAVAGQHPDRYEIHFWGCIDLGRSATEEYVNLRETGGPIVIRDPAGAIKRDELSAEAAAWRVLDPLSGGSAADRVGRVRREHLAHTRIRLARGRPSTRRTRVNEGIGEEATQQSDRRAQHRSQWAERVQDEPRDR